MVKSHLLSNKPNFIRPMPGQLNYIQQYVDTIKQFYEGNNILIIESDKAEIDFKNNVVAFAGDNLWLQ